VGPVSCMAAGDIRATLLRIFAYMGALGMLAMAAASLFQEPSIRAAAGPAARPEWVAIERPHPAFELTTSELAANAPDYAILRRNSDGARKDVMTVGDVAAHGPYVTVEIERPGAAGEQFIDAPSEIAARILRFTVTEDVKPAGTIETKFATFDLVDFAIAAPARSDAPPRRCLGFVHAFTEPVVQIAGWYCSAGEEAVDRARLACLLDRLTLVSAGGDEALAGLFARAEIRRTFCGQRSPILAATPERAFAVTSTAHGGKSRLTRRLAAH
jgi:hypothetical protein